jgi:HEAT repeat protein
MKAALPLLAVPLVLVGLASYSAAATATNGAQGAAVTHVAERTSSLSSTDPRVRGRAACDLGELGRSADSAIGSLRALMSDNARIPSSTCDRENGRYGDGETTVGELAALALARINGPAVDALLDATSDANAVTREHAAFGLGLAGDPRAVPRLVRLLSDREATVRSKSAWALGLQGDSRSVEPLTVTLRDESEDVRCQAAWALGLKGDSRAVEPLVNALSDPAPRVRAMAAWSLGLKGDSRSVEALMRRLSDDDMHTAAQAAWALGLKGDARAEEALSTALSSPSNEVRKQAAWALGMLGLRHGAPKVTINPDPNPRPNVSVRHN